MMQLVVAATSVVAALSVGCSIGYPGVLLDQLAANDSSIQLDLDTSSWIGSIHGLAGIPTIVLPALMQWKGRKMAFIAACLINLTGWVLMYTATSARSLLISESINGFGSHSVLTATLISMSEMLSPEYRNVLIVVYFVVQTLGMALVQIIGKYLYWRTVSLAICIPMVSAAAMSAFVWPESPSWLAYKGKFDKCEKAFTRLRGASDIAKTELEDLIEAQKENLARDKWCNQTLPVYLWQKIKSRDFYLPILHVVVLLDMANWSGFMVIIIYASEIIIKATHSKEAVFWGGIVLNCTMFLCYIIHIILVRFLRPKQVFLLSTVCTITCLLCASAVSYCQTIGLIAEQSLIFFYFLVGFMISIALGVLPIVYSKATELMPVKHRDVGVPVGVICSCVLDASSLKLAPYLFRYINFSGTMLIYAVNTILCGLFVWKFVPETKGRTLQQLEDYYTYGGFGKHHRPHTQKSLNPLTHKD